MPSHKIGFWISISYVSMFEFILKGHAEGEAEAEKGSCLSQREEETDQAAAATNDLGEKDTSIL